LLAKVRNEWLSLCDIFSYCLMPNHFHFMLQVNEDGCGQINLKGKWTHMQNLSKAIGKSLSSYTQAINIQNNTTGSLFQKKTKAKCLTDPSMLASPFTATDYLTNCFFYIHNNPVAANLVSDLKEWPYSSWLDYYGFRNGSLCNMINAKQHLRLSEQHFKSTIYQEPNEKIIASLW
jgi:REP-associated tyrosine transposase